MSLKGNKFVRFKDWSSEKSYSSEQYSLDEEEGFYKTKIRPALRDICSSIRRAREQCSDKIETLKTKRPPLTLSFSNWSKDRRQPVSKTGEKKILDPQGPFLQKWNKVFVLACFIAVSVDPLFFYIPFVDGADKCLDLDKKLGNIACVLRTLIDVFYVLRIYFNFRTGFIAPSSRVFGRGELVDDPIVIFRRYLRSQFFVDVLSILPLPQVVIWIILPQWKGLVSLAVKNLLKFVILIQYIPRFYRIHPLFKEVTRTSGILTERAWAGAAFNLLLYMLASHVIGAFWYLFSIESEDKCWHEACEDVQNCNPHFLYCGEHRTMKYEFLNNSCMYADPDQVTNISVFDFGIYADALQYNVLDSKNIGKKLFYCLWWGLRNLSSLGQNLKTSTSVEEIFFAIFISIAGLVLFALLIGNMQKYLQSTTVRVEEMRVKRRDVEQWMSHRMLPENLKGRIRQYEQYKWQETRGVEERALIHSLPKDLRRDINRHLCLDLIMRVPIFEKMDEHILDAVCDRLRPALYTKNSYIIREGDPVDEMIFIMRGDLVTMTTNGGRTGFFNEVYLKAGDFCGEGLLTWALDPQSSTNLPISSRTVKALTEVEAFALVSEDLKTVASQFRRLHHKDIQHTFRFCSVQWRTWAACFIQAAWRRYSRRMIAKSLRQAEDKLQDALANQAGTSPSLGVAIYASRFATNVLRNLRQSGAAPTPRLPQRLPLLPQKPAEPDFSAQYRK